MKKLFILLFFAFSVPAFADDVVGEDQDGNPVIEMECSGSVTYMYGTQEEVGGKLYLAINVENIEAAIHMDDRQAGANQIIQNMAIVGVSYAETEEEHNQILQDLLAPYTELPEGYKASFSITDVDLKRRSEGILTIEQEIFVYIPGDQSSLKSVSRRTCVGSADVLKTL